MFNYISSKCPPVRCSTLIIMRCDLVSIGKESMVSMKERVHCVSVYSNHALKNVHKNGNMFCTANSLFYKQSGVGNISGRSWPG